MNEIIGLILGCVFLAILVMVGMFCLSFLMGLGSMIVAGVCALVGWLWGLVFGE